MWVAAANIAVSLYTSVGLNQASQVYKRGLYFGDKAWLL